MRYLLTLCFLLFFTFSHSQEYTKSFSVELDSIDNILASLPPCKDATIIESEISAYVSDLVKKVLYKED